MSPIGINWGPIWVHSIWANVWRQEGTSLGLFYLFIDNQGELRVRQKLF